MSKRFVTLEECDENLRKAEDEFDSQIWSALKEAVEKGYFVMFDEDTEKFRIVEPGRPLEVVA